VLLLARGWGLASLGIAHVVAVAVTALLSTLLRRGHVPGVRFRPSLVSREHLRKISRSGVWFSLGGLAGILIVGADRVVAAKLLSLEAVTVLYLSSRLYGLAADLLAPIAESARPTLGRLLGQGDHAEAHRVYRLVNRISLSLAVVAALAIWAGNRTFVAAWVGPENYGGWALDAALALGLVARLAPLPSRAALASGLVVKSQTLVRLGEGALNLALSVALTPLLGLAGVALSTPLAAALTSLWCLPRLAGRLFPLQRQMQRYSDGLAVALLAVPLAGVAGWSRLAASQAGGYTGAALAMTITLAAGLTLIWWTGMKARTRSALRRLLPA
jgi:O-antigen/teichoic acid export membrane protein